MCKKSEARIVGGEGGVKRRERGFQRKGAKGGRKGGGGGYAKFFA